MVVVIQNSCCLFDTTTSSSCLLKILSDGMWRPNMNYMSYAWYINAHAQCNSCKYNSQVSTLKMVKRALKKIDVSLRLFVVSGIGQTADFQELVQHFKDNIVHYPNVCLKFEGKHTPLQLQIHNSEGISNFFFFNSIAMLCKCSSKNSRSLLLRKIFSYNILGRSGFAVISIGFLKFNDSLIATISVLLAVAVTAKTGLAGNVAHNIARFE